jgi:Protein of unknown function (DUF2971)
MPMNQALRKEWAAAGYRRNMGSAAVVPPPPKDFIRVYHITSAEFGVSSVGLGRMKVARFLDLNDPFELMAMNFRERKGRKLIREFKNIYDSHTGLLCFSADWTNPVLWSHYGSRHRGICLGFDLRRSLAREVRYADERILTKLGDGPNPLSLDEELQEALLCTKFRHWHYEEEVRVFVALKDAIKEGQLHFYAFDSNLQLTEVILGPQCPLSLDAVRRLTRVQHPHAVTFKARLAFKFFKVVPDETTCSRVGASG